MGEAVQVVRDEHVTVVTIDRPHAMNALDRPAHDMMAAAFDAFAVDPEQWVAIVAATGGRAFCAGNDLKQDRAFEDMVPDSGFGGLTNRFDLDKPVIAAIDGMAFGGGFELALACDLFVAGETAAFALPEVRVGLAPMGGGLLHLPTLIGAKRAMELILTGRRMSAAEALSLGIVNRVVPAGEALAAARALAAEIVVAAPLAVRATKATMRRALQADIATAMTEHLAYPEIVAMLGSEDAREGARAFAEKRRPGWSGRGGRLPAPAGGPLRRAGPLRTIKLCRIACNSAGRAGLSDRLR